jgi:hypothetical protein
MMSNEQLVGNKRRLWESIRQALIIALGAIEEYLGLPRSIVPRRKRPRNIDVNAT